MKEKVRKILAIETSCDETAVSIVCNDPDPQKRIINQSLYSQIDIHKKYGGVVPELAARSHMQNLAYLFKGCLKESNLKLKDIDGFAATSGPGLIGGLIVGLMSIKAIAASLNKPFFAINHLEGHALTPRLSGNTKYPYLLLLISGGHCQFVEVKKLGSYKVLGKTRDDAAGEAFDKAAKQLDLPYPGGPSIELAALTGNDNRFPFPKPFRRKSHADFSFSGLKTSVRQQIEKCKKDEPKLSQQTTSDIAASFQKTVAEVIADRLQAALNMTDCERVVVAGGVAANTVIRSYMEDICTKNGRIFYAPPIDLCTDNAAMIGWAALERLETNLTSPLTFTPKPRWSMESL